jgi:hypothetical protein
MLGAALTLGGLAAVKTPGGSLPVKGVGVILTGLGVSIMAGGVWTSVRSRQLLARAASSVMAESPLPPVLYLRSFVEDRVASQRLTLGTRSQEEQMVRVLRRIGPVIAVGAPGEQLPILGAAREYLSDDDWQQWVVTMMVKSSLIVFRPGASSAFWWEVAAAAEHVSPQRIAFLLPQDPATYELVRAQIDQYFTMSRPLPQRLPKLPDAAKRGDYGVTDLWGLLYFESSGDCIIRSVQPRAVTLREALLWAFSLSYMRRHRARFENLFRPLLYRAGVRSYPFPTLTGAFALVGCLLFLPVWAWRRLKGKPALPGLYMEVSTDKLGAAPPHHPPCGSGHHSADAGDSGG